MSNYPSQCRNLTILLALLSIAGLCLVAGCGGDRLPVAPAEGKVLYNDTPLEFGSVTFQPKAGPPARGTIQSDGTFVLSTYGTGDGAIIGPHEVRITCFESQRPGYEVDTSQEEAGVGKPLIPRKYANPGESGLKADVKEENEPFVFELTDG